MPDNWRWRDKARLGHAWSLYRLERFDAARAILESLVTSPTLGAQATYWLGLTQKALNQWDAAAETLLLLVKEPVEFEEATAARYHAADALLRAGKVETALEHFDQILDDQPSGPWSDDSMLRKLEAEFASGNHQTIGPMASDFRQRFPNSELLWQVRRIEGRALLAQGRHSEAIELFANAPREAPLGVDRRRDLYLLASAYQGVERYEEALETLEPLLANASDRLADDAQLLSGTALVGLKRFDEAIPPLRRYLVSRPDGSGAARCRAELTICYARTDRLDQARRALDDLRHRHADDPLITPTTLHLAEAAYAADQFDWASELFSVLTERSHSADVAARATSGLAWCLYRIDDFEEASGRFGLLLQEHADHPLAPEAALARARSLGKLEQPDAALAALQVLFDSYPRSEQVPEALLMAARLYDQLEQGQQAADQRAGDTMPLGFSYRTDHICDARSRRWLLHGLARGKRGRSRPAKKGYF